MSSRIGWKGNDENMLTVACVKKSAFILSFCLMVVNVRAETVLDFWHSYTHAQTNKTHYGFRLTQYKRGLFWGSCGPSTRSQQWAFSFDLAGEGPVYSNDVMSASDDNGQALHIVSGRITADMKRGVASIEVQVESGGKTNNFVGNGGYIINRSK